MFLENNYTASFYNIVFRGLYYFIKYNIQGIAEVVGSTPTQSIFIYEGSTVLFGARF